MSYVELDEIVACSENLGLPNRCESRNGCRYCFNGMEKDYELYSVAGSSYDFGARMHNSNSGSGSA